jgi:hypothetical protein
MAVAMTLSLPPKSQNQDAPEDVAMMPLQPPKRPRRTAPVIAVKKMTFHSMLMHPYQATMA